MPDPMRSYLDFEKPVAELEAKIDELRALAADRQRHRRGDRASSRTRRAQALTDLYANADAVAEDAGGAPSAAAAFHRLHQRR